MNKLTVVRPNESTPPLATGGGGPHDPGMEARVAKLESSVEHILRDTTEIKSDIRELRSGAKEDFHKTFAALIVVALGLAYLMAQGFDWL